MSSRHAIAFAALVLTAFANNAQAAPLDASPLYKAAAQGCRTVDLANWRHPTRKVLEGAKAEIVKMELCKGGVFPIFTARFAASPMLGVNDKFFNRLHAELAAANGFHPFMIVDPGWGVITNVAVPRKREISVDYDEFDAPAPK